MTLGTTTVSGRWKTLRMVGWDKPENGWIKLNIDGAAKGNPGWAGGGGILQDE